MIVMNKNLEVCKPLVVTPSEYDQYPVCEDYVAILQLAQRCANREIPYVLKRCWDGWIVILEKDGARIADAIEHNGSYGHEGNLLETMDFPEDNNDVTGWLTVDEVWERITRLYRPRLDCVSTTMIIPAE